MASRQSRCHQQAAPSNSRTLISSSTCQNSQKQLDVIYADFEAITEKVSGCTQCIGKSHTSTYQKHTDCRYRYKLVYCYDDKPSKLVEVFRGENAVNKFVGKMLEEVKYCPAVKEKHLN